MVKLVFQDANTTEVDPDIEHALVIDMPEHHPGHMGGTMRLGKRTTLFREEKSVISMYCVDYLLIKQMLNINT